jgi:hypothetical protein
MHKRILVPRVGTALAGVVLPRVQTPARFVNAWCNRVEMEVVTAPLSLRNSVTDHRLATADA